MDRLGIDLTNFSFDKSNWTKVKLGDVVAEPKETMKDFAKEKIEHVVGLEHIDSEDIHLRRAANMNESTTFTKKFAVGDVLFGRRRAYLKKAAQAEFSGICSGDITVMRAKENLLPELLPFVINNEKFFDYAVTHSAGSLSPRVKFKDLANYEFLFPPKDQQAKLAELLWAMDETIQNQNNLLVKMVSYKHAYRKSVFCGYDRKLLKSYHNVKSKKGWSVSAVGDVCHIENNLRKPISKEIRAGMQGEYPYYGPTSVLDNICEFRVEGEYVLIGEDGDHFLKYADWNMTQYVVGKFNVNNHAHILRGTEKCLTKWLFYSLQHRNVIPHITKQGATRYKLNKESLQNIPLLVPPLVEQHKLVKKFDTIENNIKEIKSKVAISTDFSRSLINQVL